MTEIARTAPWRNVEYGLLGYEYSRYRTCVPSVRRKPCKKGDASRIWKFPIVQTDVIQKFHSP
jgi:hypothetical protein